MKKCFLISVIIILLPLFANASAVKIDGIYYNLNLKVQTAEVTYGDELYSGQVNIPEKIKYEGKEYTVTSIGDWAFNHQGDMTYVYYNSNLQTVTIPNSVTKIGDFVFRGCSGLSSVTIGNSVTSIGNYTFRKCYNLKTITIPNSVTSIGSMCFAECTNLSSVIIGNSVKELGSFLFSGCSSLKNVTIGNSVTTIESDAFYCCTSLSSVIIPNSVTFLSGFRGCTGLTSVTIGSSVNRIGYDAFYQCSSLTSINIPNSVEDINGNAFYGCTSMTSINIGKGVKTIGEKAFAQCSDIADVYCMAKELSATENDAEGRLYTYNNAFDGSYIDYATLHIPESATHAYMNIAPWNRFGKFMTLSGEEIETPQCATPNITYDNGEITFSCETEGVEFIADVTTKDVKRYCEDKITISNIYQISVYATKAGYDNSDTVTMELLGTGGKLGDLNGDGKVNVADHVKLTEIIMSVK